MLREIRRGMIAQAKRAGALSLIAGSQWRRSRLLILCYHGISLEDEHVWNPALFMAPALFRSRLEILRAGGYNVLALAEGLERLWAGDLPPRSVAITVDDGFYNFHAVALPVLREFGYPATVYLRTDYSGHQLPVFPLAAQYLLWKTRASTLDGLLIGEPGPMDIASSEARALAFRRINQFVREQGFGPREKHELARRLGVALGVDYERIDASRLMHLLSDQEIKALPPELVDIQLHTHRHTTPRHRERFMAEIRDNRAFLETLRPSGPTPVHFCYPSGDYDSAFLPWLRELGVISATIGERGLANRASEPLLLPRFVDTTAVSAIDFEGWLTGFAAWLPRRRWRSRARR